MKQLQLVRVEVGELLQGMYIANLDRPWLGSPFLMEGFLLEEVDDLDKLRALCEYVMVDVGRSSGACQPGLLARLGPQQKPAPPERAQVPRRATASLVQAPSAQPAGPDVDRMSMTDALSTITREIAQGTGLRRDGANPGLTIFRDTDQQAADARTAQGFSAAPQRRRELALESQGEDWASSSHGKGTWNGVDRRRWPRAPQHGVGLSGHDEASLAGPAVDLVTDGKGWRAGPQMLEAHRLQDSTRVLIHEMLASASADQVLDIQKAESLISEIADNLQQNPESLRMLSRLNSRDDYSVTHAFKCMTNMMDFGQALGYGRESRQSLGVAGLVLDLGKIRLPDHILRSTKRLTPGEFGVVREHVMHSVDILRSDPRIGTKVLEIVAQHHERIDGSGYPYGLKGKELGPLSAISGIIDTYTALTSKRVHQPAKSIHEALSELQFHAGRLFNQGLVEEFIQLIGLYPVGALVRLNTGEVALVVNQNRVRRLKPTVMVLLDADHKRLGYPQLLNLMLDPPSAKGEPYRIESDLSVDAFPDLDPTEFYLGAARDEAA